jgi:NADPH-dependent F420 reductase
MQIGIVGGTGPQGRGLASRFASAGHEVTIGSRDPVRAKETAGQLVDVPFGWTPVAGGSNLDAASFGAVVVVAVPWSAHDGTLTELVEPLRGKTVVDCVNPIGFDAQGPYALRTGVGGAAVQAQRLLPTSRVVAAFHHLAAASLIAGEESLAYEDILVASDDAEAKALVQDLCIPIIGRRGVDCGPLRAAEALEAMTTLLISINRRYRARTGFAVTGLAG